MEALDAAKSLLPAKLSKALERYPEAEEIRLRRSKKAGVVVAGREYGLSDDAIDQSVLFQVLEKATGASLHTAAPLLKGGFVSYQGLRIGVCGEAVYTGQELKTLRNFSSIAIRIPHAAITGCGTLIESLLRPIPASTLICAPPGVGKTSFLRELIRHAARVYRVAVIDERNELSASALGQAQFELGYSSDIMVGVSKEKAAMMLLRGMNPQIIAMDEITKKDDLAVIEDIAGCGVILFATAHGRDLEDMKRRPVYKGLLDSGIFEELVEIRCSGGKRQYSRVTLK